MTKLKELMRERFSLANMLFSALFSLLCCFIIYPVLLPLCTYNNLNDFYVGISIYENHNKYLDIGMVFLYVGIFYIIFLLNRIDFSFFSKIRTEQYLIKYKKYLNLFLALIITVLGVYILCKPHGVWMIDTHHYGEKFAVYYAHIKYGMKYYSDIMLVHGFLDVLPSMIANSLPGGLSFANERLAANLVVIMFCVLNAVLSFFIFRKDLIFALFASGALMYFLNLRAIGSIHCFFFVLCYLVLVHFYKKNSIIWYGFFYSASCFMLLYHTTIGTACFAASVPLLIRKILDNKKSGIIFLFIAGIITYFVFGNLIVDYMAKAQYYLSSNLYAFGDGFPQKIDIYKFVITTFGFLSIPFFLNLIFVSKDKKIFYAALYVLIFAVSILGYSFGRTDVSSFVSRAYQISFAVLMIILPYISYTADKNKYLLKVLLCLILISFVRIDIPSCTRFYEDRPVVEYMRNLPEGTYLDLTNKGMNYYCSARKPAIPYTSYYNIVNTKQTKDLLEELKKNPPRVVLVNSHNGVIVHDGIKPPQRINAIYKWLYTSGNYKQIEDKFFSLLVYSPGSAPHNPLKADSYISALKLQYLPDAWGASINTLPAVRVDKELSIKAGKIIVNNGIRPDESDLLYLEYKSVKPVEFFMTVNDIPSILQFKSRKGKLLIPLDNYPSWLCAEKIDYITLKADKDFEIEKAVLYKRD